MSYFLLGTPYKVPPETRDPVHRTLQNTPKASPLMLNRGWRWVCGGNDIWIGPWKIEDMNKRAGHNLRACWHCPNGCSYFFVPEENWLESPSSILWRAWYPPQCTSEFFRGLAFFWSPSYNFSVSSPCLIFSSHFFSISACPTSLLSSVSQNSPHIRLLSVWICR